MYIIINKIYSEYIEKSFSDNAIQSVCKATLNTLKILDIG